MDNLTYLKEALRRTIADAKAIDDLEEKTDEQAAEFVALMEGAKSLKAQLDEATKEHKETDDNTAFLKSLEGLLDVDDAGKSDAKSDDDKDQSKNFAHIQPGGKTPEPVDSPKTIGEGFVKSETYLKMMHDGGGRISENDMKTMGPVDTGISVKSLIEHSKAVFTAPTAEVRNTYALNPQRLGLLNAVTVVPMGAESVKVHQLSSDAPAAVAAEGAAKAEATFTWTPVTLVADIIAEWLPITLQAASAASTIETLVTTQLTKDVMKAIQTDIATDLAAASGVIAQAFAVDTFTSIRNGMAALDAIEAPDVLLMNAADKAATDIIKTTDGIWQNGGPYTATSNPWGLNTYEGGIAAGFAYLGPQGSLQWWERENITVKFGWRNDDFTKNQWTILAEAWGVPHIMTPVAWAKVDLTA